MTALVDPPDDGPLRGLLVPTLTGVAASGLLVASWAFAQGDLTPILGLLILAGGAAVIGIVIGNPGNELATLTGTLLPGVLLAAIEQHHGCFASVGLVLVWNVVSAIALMFLGLIVGIIWGRGLGIRPLRRPYAVVVLTFAALLAIAGWVALGSKLAAGSVC
jgi:hypothetical protein